MKWSIRNLSIRTKLMVVTMGATVAALMVAGIALAICDLATARANMADDITMHAAVIAENVTAAVSFGDQTDAASTLGSLRATGAEAAAIYDEAGTPLASFTAVPAWRDRLPSAPGEDGTRFHTDRLDTFQPIVLGGNRIGTVYVRVGLGELAARYRELGLTFTAAMAGACAVALWLASRLRRLICDPIQELAAVAGAVSRDRDYRIRAVRAGDDEVGQLTDGFNQMLEQVEARDAELQAHREHLEDQVAIRTAELASKANELSALNAQLTIEKDRAEQASRSKSAFLANMSHEIRTPMTAIVGYANLMLMPTQTMSDRIDSLQVIRRNARHLMELINDILDLSKIEAERMVVETLPCDLPQIVVDVASMLRARAMEKGLSLRVDFGRSVPKTIHCDALRLKQVLMNLVGNAVKFTENGDVCLALEVVDVPPVEPGRRPTSRVLFHISDTGIGMTAEQIARLFQPFVQADESMTRKYGGSGLGLVISQRLARLMGGDIAIRSEPGRGSTFTVSIDGGDLTRVQWLDGLTESVLQPQAPAQPEEVRINGRILLAEDGPDNRHLISLHLTMGGADVTTAENGRIAVDMVRAQPFDLILMDMQMPELDGYGATSELRRRGVTLPIIALTAHAMTGDREKCLAAGCTDYLTKPIDPELLLRTVDHYIRRHRRGESQEPSGSAPQEAPGSTGVGSATVVAGGHPPAGAAESASASESEAIKPKLTLPKSPAAAQAMQQAVEQFINRLPQRVDELTRLMDEESLAELQRSVHQLKGAGTGYGFPQVTTLAAQAEVKLKQSAPLDEVRAGVEELVALIRRVEGYPRQKELYVHR